MDQNENTLTRGYQRLNCCLLYKHSVCSITKNLPWCSC